MNVEITVRRIAEWSVRHPRLVLMSAGVLLSVSLALAAARMQLKTSNLDLIDAHLPEVRRFMEFADEFGTPNVLAVVFESADPKAIEAAVRRIGPVLREIDGVRNVVDRMPLDAATRRNLGLDEFMRSPDGTLCCVFVQPEDSRSSASTIEPMVRSVRHALSVAGLADLGVKAGLTGLPAYALDDREVIQRDIMRLSAVSLALIVALFIASFGAFRRPVMAMVSLSFGIAVAMGFASLYPGHLTLLSAFFVSILFGLCDDLGIQTVSRIEELILQGEPEAAAIPAALGGLARGMITGTGTTALAFFSMAGSGFRGFAELGVIAGVGALLCLIATLTVLPALLSIWRIPQPRTSIHADRLYGAILSQLRHPAWAIAFGIAGAVAAWLPGPRFDSDYLNLEPRGSEAVRWEREMVKRTDFSTQFAAFIADSREHAGVLHDKLLGERCVGEIRSIADIELLERETGTAWPLPASYRAALQSDAGRFAVYAYPQGDVWQEPVQREFISRMRAIDPAVTGMPFLGHFMVGQSLRGMRLAAGFAALALVICVALDFRKPWPFALAILPTAMSILSLRGIMGALDLAFNPLNVMAIPVIIGLAVNYGVHLVHRFREERGDLDRTLRGTGRSVLLSALTTLVGFGTLMFSEHRGLASFAQVMTIGLAAALIYSIAVLPALMRKFQSSLITR